MFGHTKRLLRINLTGRKVEVEELPENLLRKYIGGLGIGAKILYEETRIETKPLSPDNLLIAMTGPFTGTGVPTSGRHHLVSRSPATGFFGESNVGGSLGKIRFIEEKIWEVISGIPLYDSSQKTIEFKLFRPLRTHSFIVTKDYAGFNTEIIFNLHIGDETVFNFIFNYENEERFHMLRFETRKNEFCGILRCEHKYGWRFIEEYNSEWNIKTAEPNKVSIRIDSGNLKCYISHIDVFV